MKVIITCSHGIISPLNFLKNPYKSLYSYRLHHQNNTQSQRIQQLFNMIITAKEHLQRDLVKAAVENSEKNEDILVIFAKDRKLEVNR